MLTRKEQMSPAISQLFNNFIAAKGLNMSRQRTLILDAFLSAGPRINVDDLYITLRARHPTLGRSTVYRTLKLLVECGIAREQIVEGESVHYEKYTHLGAAHETEKCTCHRATNLQRKTLQNHTEEKLQ